ncbi:DXO1 [Candida margitis]|uniref:DXO1 n=1 Tax=Candida margitis TaxID=1775924 RepID=UPI002226B44E|nr:DXO1 [Candida margitis]KAI5965423.1 DXO1 [Candida margitis]
MLDKLRLSLFENIVNGSKIANEEELNAALEVGGAFSCEPEELCYYTKDETELNFANHSGLDELKIPFASKNKKKKQKRKEGGEKDRPIIGTCLTEGFDDFVSPNLNDVYSLNDLFRSLQYLIESGKLSRDKLKVLTMRRHLMKLMCVPFNKQQVNFNVIYWRGLIIFAYDWGEEMKLVSDSYQRMYQYSGYEFEKVVTETMRDSKSRFYTVVQHSVGDNPVCYSAEIDCAISKEPGLANYVELKTHSKLLDDKFKTANKLQRKLMTLYCQNKFISCNYSLIGFRSMDFKLASIKKYTECELIGRLNALPIFLTHGCSIKTKHMFQWYNLVICWLCQKQFDDDRRHVFKLSFEREPELMDSHLNMKAVTGAEELQIFNKLVPEWFQNFY